MKAKFTLIPVIICIAFCGLLWIYALNKQTKDNADDMLEKENKPTIILEDKDSNISVPFGWYIQYSHSVHESVGFGYNVEYDKNAFELSEKLKYNNPDAIAKGMCGGDQAILTSTLTPKHTGNFTVKVIHTFRGNEERILKYNITIR